MYKEAPGDFNPEFDDKLTFDIGSTCILEHHGEHNYNQIHKDIKVRPENRPHYLGEHNRHKQQIGTRHYAENGSHVHWIFVAFFGNEKQLQKQERAKRNAALQQAIDSTKVSTQRDYLVVADRNGNVHSEYGSVIFMDEHELPALDIDDPVIHNELERIQETEDYDNDLCIRSDTPYDVHTCIKQHYNLKIYINISVLKMLTTLSIHPQ
ncbi:hypothetical protein BDC45DRAFT_609746 [Circinella umbellata]|nr:hypothetical protein BDC45DRAFT_609746 [Circinella umbellata]